MSLFIFLFILGISVGSFLNVLIDRLPRDESVIGGRSHCESCKHALSWFDLVPLFSFVQLAGKCRYCRVSLSFYYPMVELITGVLFAFTYWSIIAEKFQISNFKYPISNNVLEIGSIGTYLTLVFILYIVSSLIVIFLPILNTVLFQTKLFTPLLL